MKQISIIVGVILLLLIGSRFLSNHFHGTSFYSATLSAKPPPELVSQATAEQLAFVKPTAALPVQSSGNAVESDLTEVISSTAKQKMRFEDDWCIAAIDLDEHEFAYYQRELNDWALARGQIRLPHPWLPDLPLDELGQYLLPYLDATKTELIDQIRADNEFAMLLALSRRDFSFTQQQRIARRLVTKGHTGNALAHLVLLDLINAEMEYKKLGVINTDIETKLHKVMAYMAYGIEYGDLTATFTYLNVITTGDFPVALSHYFSTTTANQIPRYVDGLKQTIERARSKSHVFLPSFNELPKAAKHQYESMLARMYIDYPAQLQSLQTSLAASVGDRMTPSDCVNKQVTFFSELEQRARDSIKAANRE